MDDVKNYSYPDPVLDPHEQRDLEDLKERYERLVQPGPIKRGVGKIGELVPQNVKDFVGGKVNEVSQAEIYKQALEIAAGGFKTVEEQVARFTINSGFIIDDVNKVVPNNEVTSISEITLARSYDLMKRVEALKMRNLGLTMVEGAATGAPGFPGIPFNLVLSTLIYFRAVQSVAMYYGYDVKSDPRELTLAGQVFSQAMDPSSSKGEAASMIAKVMVISEAACIKQAAGKGWYAMASRGGATLAIAQMRALANKAAQKALEKAGKETLENSIFKAVLEQIGARTTLSLVDHAVPFVSAIFCAGFDTATMNKVMDFASIFYCKRFLLEKEIRLAELSGETVILEVDDC